MPIVRENLRNEYSTTTARRRIPIHTPHIQLLSFILLALLGALVPGCGMGFSPLEHRSFDVPFERVHGQRI